MEDAPGPMFVLAIKDFLDQHALCVSYLKIFFLDSEMQFFDKKGMT